LLLSFRLSPSTLRSKKPHISESLYVHCSGETLGTTTTPGVPLYTNAGPCTSPRR
jgi:hypothetical protein